MLIYYLLFTFNIITMPINKYSQKIYFCLNGFVVWFMMAFKSLRLGADTPTYVSLYREASTTVIPNNFINWFFPANGARFENGYLVLNKLLNHIDANPQFLFIVTATIFIICLAFMVNSLHLNSIVGILTFECLGFFSFFMSGLRQALACSLCMVAFVFAVKKKPVKFLIFYYLALSMHSSAIVFIVVYLINYLKDSWKSRVFVIITSLVFFLSFDKLFAHVATNSQEMSNFTSSTTNSGGYLNVSLSIIVIIIFLVAIQHINLPTANYRLSVFAKYMLWGAIIYYLLSLRSTQLARIAIYFSIGYFPLLSYLFDFSPRRIRVINQAVIVIALIMYLLVILIFRPSWTGIVPYTFCFQQS